LIYENKNPFLDILVGLLGQGVGPSQNVTEKRGHTSIPPVGFESTDPVFERSKIVRALDRTTIGNGPGININS